jgi:hypothetical protein
MSQISGKRDMSDWLDSEEFYELCQTYRHVNQRTSVGEEKTAEAFEALKEYIRGKLKEELDEYAEVAQDHYERNAVHDDYVGE